MRTLERTHPLICFVYMIAVMGVTIFTRNPLLVAQSLLGAALLLVISGKGTAVLWSVPAVILCALTNPLFSHSGDTVLFFIGDAAYTLEALVYGAVFGGMLAAVCGWGICSVRFVTSDKYIWLFGRILPVSGLVLSCSMRMIPLFVRRIRSFSEADGSDTLRGSLSAFSASLGYSAEQAMISADSMKARGYGTAVRTSYSIYRFGGREVLQLIVVAAFSAVCIVMMATGSGSFECYPGLSRLSVHAADVALYVAFGALCLLPSLTSAWEQFYRLRGYSRIKEH